MYLYQIDIGYACFGVTVDNCIIIEAAPIASWMIGKSLDTISKWLLRKNGTIILVSSFQK
jgi:hypothetical protein